MSVLLGIGIISTVTVVYLGKKGWQAFHSAVGITPGTLTYQDLSIPVTMRWQQLDLDKRHLADLPTHLLAQLQRIDNKTEIYLSYEQTLNEQYITPVVTENQFNVQKLLQTRLPEMLASRYRLFNSSLNTQDHAKQEANTLLQEVLDTIEQRLDTLLKRIEADNIQELRVMKRYIDSQE